MKITRADVATSIALPSLVSAAALTADWQYGQHATAVEFITAIAAGKLSFVSFAKKWPQPLSWGAAAAAAAFTQAGVTGAASGMPAVYAWLVSGTESLHIASAVQ